VGLRLIGRFGRGRRRALVIGAALAAAGALAAGAAAAPGTTYSAFSPFGRLPATGKTPSALAQGSWWGGPGTASTGETVTVYLSDTIPVDESVRSTWVNFFAWLHHGPELSSLTAYVAPLDQVKSICGPEAGGCYSPASKVLVIPGDLSEGTGFDIAAHEYGHHIAANRRNDPWNANGYGPKRWATYVGVCSRATAGTAFPGDEGPYYTLNTGEAFAEAYRALEEARGVYPWAHLPLVVDASFTPEAGSEAAALADVQEPWNGPATATWDGRFELPTVGIGATVGPGRAIAVRSRAGATVKRLTAGTYALTVRDRSVKDNFHLTGDGVDRKTGLPGRGQVTWTLDLKPGVYRYRSDARPALGGSFAVGPATTIAPLERSFATGLDGTFQATVAGPANASLEVLDPATGNPLAGPTPGAVSATVCGQRSVLLRVKASRPGTFHVTASTP
jgi:hypothetical protein